MRLYHYTLKENVFGMYKEGIRPFSYWCKSIEDCNKFLLLYMKTGVIPSSALIAYVHIDFDESKFSNNIHFLKVRIITNYGKAGINYGKYRFFYN